MITLEQLMQFCSKDESRPNIAAPFTIGEYTYATDGRVVVRVKGMPVPTLKIKPPDATVLAWNTSAREVLVNIPVLPYVRQTKCKNCEGSGMCSCGSCGDSHTCAVCEGDGNEFAPDKGVEVGKMFLGESYLRKLSMLPDLKVYDNGGEYEVTYFTFDGGEGLLMPMRRR